MTLAPPEAGPAEVDALHASMLRFFPELVGELGGDPRALLRRAGVNPGPVPGVGPGASPGHAPAASYRQTIQLLNDAAIALRCPDFGMRLARRQGGCDVYGPLGPVMKNSRTFGDALRYVVTHNFAHSLAARIWLRPHRQDRSVFSGHDILLDRIANKTQAIEHIMLLGSLGAMELTSGYVRARKISFRHQPLSTPETYRRYFGCEILFGQTEDGVVYSEQDMACPITNPDPTTYQAATSFIDAEFTRHMPPLGHQLRFWVIRCLGTEYCTNEHVAARLGMHSRTLHRRLAAEGTSFQHIKDEVRRDAMLYYIQHTDLEFSVISEKLGFAEPSVLTRRCNSWFAMPPSRLRSLAHDPSARLVVS